MKSTDYNIDNILEENERRNNSLYAPFNPITGENSILERKALYLPDCPLPTQYLPLAMFDVPLVQQLEKAGSIANFIEEVLEQNFSLATSNLVVSQLMELRCDHDFCFWAAWLTMIKGKGGGGDIHFVLNYPQRILVTEFEKMRLAGMPIRLILLKARQWGGSTVTQIYMAWLQIRHKTGLNSLIVGHVKDASNEVKDMFTRMIKAYPVEYLYPFGADFNENEKKTAAVGNSTNITRIIARNCKIKIGTAEEPDSARGGDYNLVHCTEVGLWKATLGKKPEDIIRAATSGIMLRPYTMIVYESTANGTGNFFHAEYEAAKNGTSQFKSLFIPWYYIENDTLPIKDLRSFAEKLYINRNNENVNSNREESGKYLWWLWQQGATLEGINWYISERAKFHSHADFASEAPTTDVEAFVSTGSHVFDNYQVNELKATCRPPRYIGDIYGDAISGEDSLKHVRFHEDKQGMLWVWAHPEIDEDEPVSDRYLVVVDIGGRTAKADWSVIVVFDRIFQAEGGQPVVVAQWYGHTYMDLLAWKAAQIAQYYDNALLVIEKNTVDTNSRDRMADADHSAYILNQVKDYYPNLYARRQSEEEIRTHKPRKYGFHTNVATKPVVIDALTKAVREQLWIERDERCINELLVYEQKKDGSYGAAIGYHDDLLMTRAIGLHIAFSEMPLPRIYDKNSMQPQKGHKKIVSAATI